MASKLRRIMFCGKERTFKRCANKELRDYQKQLEDIQDEAVPFTEEVRDMQFAIDEKESEISSIDKNIELLEKLNDPDDEEIRECMKLVSIKNGLQRELHDLRKNADEKQLENRELGRVLDEKLRDSYATFANKVFEDFDKSDFDEYADSTDFVVAQRLSELYRLATSGASQKDVDRAYQNIIKDSFQ